MEGMNGDVEKGEQAEEPKENNGSPPVRRILVVDDEIDVLTALEDFLLESDFHVVTARNAREAMERILEQPFDLVLSDLVMPRMDGIALTKSIQELGRDIPVVVMTGYASIEYAVESMKAGAADFITKPFRFDHVMLIINRVLEARKLRQLAEEREYYMELSNLDGLTQIGNFRYFQHMLQKEIERQKRYNRTLSLMIIDIDDFKHYNDDYGHLVGDMVLLQVASMLKRTVRDCDIVARYGGEEFTVILPEISDREAMVVGERVIRSIENQLFATDEGHQLGQLSVTVGLASYPRDAQEKKELIDAADRALYQGKRSGKRCLCYFENGAPVIQRFDG